MGRLCAETFKWVKKYKKDFVLFELTIVFLPAYYLQYLFVYATARSQNCGPQ